MPLKRSALHHRHVAMAAAMVRDRGWECPAQYGPPEAELRAARERVAVGDISPVGKLDVKGKRLAAALEGLCALGVLPALGVAQRVSGGSAGVEALCCRLGSDRAVLLAEPDGAAALATAFERQAAGGHACAHLTDLTSTWAGVHVVGPRSGDLLRKVTALDLSRDRFADLACAQAGVASAHAFIVRADVAGVLAYQVYCGRELAEHLWDTLLDAGAEFDAVPLGLMAQRRLAEG
ncbi:MAG: hypothetical protein AB7V27_13995 [Candidatus Binatia bacterium]